MEKPRDHARLLSPDEIDGLDTDSHESHQLDDRGSLDSTAARLREYEGSQAYQQRNNGGLYSSIMARLSPKTVRHAIIGVGVALLLILAASMLPSRKTTSVTTVVSAGAMTAAGEFKFEKPKNIHISGVIFYGRAKFVDLLDCYLQKNLAVNGGMLDDVLFMENTDNKDDIAYLHDLVERVPQYKRVPVERQGGTHGWGGFDSMWKSLQDDNTIYMKIDDDIVWIGDDAVPRMISTLLEHPEAHDIAGNIINSPLTNWMHYHQDAVHPFLPEKKPPVGGKAAEAKDWRISSMPTYDDSVPEKFDWGPLENRPDAHFAVGDVGGPPFEGHRWLPLKNDSGMLLHTPIESAQWDAFGRGWKSWSMGAQQHYSLLYNLEHDMLDRYHFGRGDGLFNMQYTRYNLNFLAIWGKSVAMQLPGHDDEEDLTVTIPLKFKRPCLINTRALVAHFNFGTQPEIQHTDLLDRYRLYANEFVCKANNQKKPLTPTQG